MDPSTDSAALDAAFGDVSAFFAWEGQKLSRAEDAERADAALIARASLHAAREVVTTKDHRCRVCDAGIAPSSVVPSVSFGWKRTHVAWHYCARPCLPPIPFEPLDAARRSRMSKTCALIRVSTDSQTVDPQREQIDRWAAAHGETVRWFEEAGVSGAARKRPVLDALMAEAREGRCRTIVVAALDRLGRSAVDLIVRLRDLRELGVRVVSLREGLDFDSPAGQLVASVLAHVAEMEREALRSRTLAGLASARAKGRVGGPPPLVWRPEELEELRRLVAEGHGLRKIQREKMLTIFRRAKRNGEWTEIPVVPSESSMRRALKASGGA